MPSKSFISVTMLLLAAGLVAMFQLQPEYPTPSNAPEAPSNNYGATAETAKEGRLRAINERLDKLDRRQQAGEDVYADRLTAYDEEIQRSEQFGYPDNAQDLRLLRGSSVAGRPLHLARARLEKASTELDPGIYSKATIRTIDDLTRKLALADEALAALDALDSAATEYPALIASELRKAGASDEFVRERLDKHQPERGAASRRFDRLVLRCAREQLKLLLAQWGHWRFVENGALFFDSKDTFEAYQKLKNEMLTALRERGKLFEDSEKIKK